MVFEEFGGVVPWRLLLVARIGFICFDFFCEAGQLHRSQKIMYTLLLFAHLITKINIISN